MKGDQGLIAFYFNFYPVYPQGFWPVLMRHENYEHVFFWSKSSQQILNQQMKLLPR